MQTTDASNFFRSEAELIAEAARTEKAERTKTIGHPVELKGKVIRLVVRDGDAWTAESGGVVRRMDLATGRVVRVFKGHTGPVTCLAFFKEGENGRTILLSGAWDQTIRTWDAETGALISTTNAHSDFLKSLLVIPHLNLLVSGSSDKHIKLWDLTRLSPALVQLGASTAHTRPVECLATDASRSPCRLYSGDSMGVIKAWDIESHAPPTDRRRLVSVGELRAHTMGVTDMWAAHGRVWSASTDNTVRVQSVEHGGTVSIEHPTHVRSLLPVHLTPAVAPVVITGSASGAIHIWDVEGGEDVSTIDGRGASANGVVDVHSHDVSALALWVRNPATEKIDEKDGIPPVKEIEAWVVSGSLDGTLRRWKLDDLVDGKHNSIAEPSSKPSNAEIFAISEEEERELAELMSDEDC